MPPGIVSTSLNTTGAKALIKLANCSARLKPCPDTNLETDGELRSPDPSTGLTAHGVAPAPRGVSPPRKSAQWRASLAGTLRPGSGHAPEATVPTRTFGAALFRPYTKKKNAARPTKKSVPPNIHNSYDHRDVICCAGKNTSAIPRIVVSRPLAPVRNSVKRPCWPRGADSVAANFTSAPNM